MKLPLAAWEVFLSMEVGSKGDCIVSLSRADCREVTAAVSEATMRCSLTQARATLAPACVWERSYAGLNCIL